jgi:hypothetical protein
MDGSLLEGKTPMVPVDSTLNIGRERRRKDRSL